MGLGKAPPLLAIPSGPLSWRQGEAPQHLPALTVIGKVLKDTGAANLEEKEPGSRQLPPAQAALPADLLCFIFSKPEEGLSPERKDTWCLIPQSRGSCGPEAPGPVSTVLPGEMQA